MTVSDSEGHKGSITRFSGVLEHRVLCPLLQISPCLVKALTWFVQIFISDGSKHIEGYFPSAHSNSIQVYL